MSDGSKLKNCINSDRSNVRSFGTEIMAGSRWIESDKGLLSARCSLQFM